MPEQERFGRTIDKTRRGELPANTDKTAYFVPGSGTECDGCGDVIAIGEKLYRVNVQGLMQLCFHHECYVAWSTYER